MRIDKYEGPIEPGMIFVQHSTEGLPGLRITQPGHANQVFFVRTFCCGKPTTGDMADPAWMGEKEFRKHHMRVG